MRKTFSKNSEILIYPSGKCSLQGI